MIKRNLDIEKLFRYDPKTNTYFYHLLATWSEDEKVPKTDEWIEVSKAVYDEIRRSEWQGIKRTERESRCQVHGKKGKAIQCPEENRCDACPYAGKDSQGNSRPGDRVGGPLSLELFADLGIEVPGRFDLGTLQEAKELAETLHKALEDLTDEDYHIIILAAGEMAEREIAARLDSKQKTINERKWKIRAHLRKVLEDYL